MMKEHKTSNRFRAVRMVKGGMIQVQVTENWSSTWRWLGADWPATEQERYSKPHRSGPEDSLEPSGVNRGRRLDLKTPFSKTTMKKTE